MTTRTWNGTTGNFTDAASWSPAGVPGAGDIAVINSGTVNASGTLSGLTISVNVANGASASSALSLNSATLDGSSSLSVTNNQTSLTAAPAIINVTGTSVLGGVESFYGTTTNFAIAAGSTLVNAGTLNFYASSPTTTGGGVLQNSGTMALVNPRSSAQVPIFADAITGTGTIAMGENARVEFAAPVSSGQTLIMNDGASGNEIAQIDQPSTFGASIQGFSASDLIAVINTPYTNATYTSTGANTGTLSLFSGGTREANLNFVGQYTLGSFQFTFNNFGGGQSNLGITTTAVNSVSAGLPSGYQAGGSGNGSGGSVGVGAVYRWFDTRFGTHFFTADAGEAATVNATRSSLPPVNGDLTPETNDFGDVSSADPNGEAVFRFFDNIHGTHFFTASAAERDTLRATRTDLVYEPNSTFYEHATQQAGDIPVYRFFDTQYGTHFYTGDAGEAATVANLLVAGTSNHQFTAEGVGFYAPAGSFRSV